MHSGYPAEAIRHDRSKGTWRLDLGFEAPAMYWHIDHGPDGAELRDDSGRLVAQGVVTADMPLALEAPNGTQTRLERLEIDGRLVLLVPAQPLEPGVDYCAASASWTGGRPARPEEIAALPCLGAGAMVATADGPQPIDWLRPGDRVLTRDNGYQPLLWLGQKTMPRRAPPETRPLIVPAGSLGPQRPERDLMLSPGTGILLAGPELNLWFGEAEMLAPAADLRPDCARAEGRQQLYAPLLEAPDIILVDGMWVASVQADAAFLSHLPDRVRAALAPRLDGPHRRACRGWLSPWEVAMVRRERIARARALAA